MNQRELGLLAALTKTKFRKFVERFWHLASPDPFQPSYHVDAICEHLQALAQGDIRRLAIQVAPRHAKSLLCSVLFPVWCWIRQPQWRVMSATYSQTLTVRDAVRSRRVLESELFKSCFPHVRLAPDENRQDKYKNTANGERFSTSTTARTAGFDADLIIADDLIDFAERSSRAALDEASDYFLRTLLARLVRLGEDRVVLAGHRISDQDVFARVQETLGDEYCYLILPEEARSLPVNSLGWKDTRAEGELLWPEAYGHEVLKGERKKYRAEYAAVFLQDPRPQEGNLFRPEWFKQYSTQEQVVEDAVQVSYRLGDKTVRASDCWRFATVDLAVSVSDSADWTVCQVWDCWRGHLILVHQLRARLDGTQIIPRLVEIQNEYKPQFMVVESEFTGKFVQDQLREKDVMVRPFRAKDHGSKEIRSIAAQVMMEDGRVWFPTDKGWVADLESELMSFPTAAHDDQVDCLSAAALTAQRYDSHEPEPVILTAEQEREQQEKERQERHLQILEAGSRF